MGQSLKFRLDNGKIESPADSELALILSMENLLDPDQLFYRYYYFKREPDGSAIFLRITDEPRVIDGDDYYKKEDEEEFTELASFTEVVDELNERTYVADVFSPTDGAPVYVYYDIEFIHETMRELFRSHLAIQLWTCDEALLTKQSSGFVNRRIDIWKKLLIPKITEEPSTSQQQDDELNRALANSSLAMSLKKPNDYYPEISDSFYRLYFKSRLGDGSKVYFLQTNEPVHQSGYLTSCKKVGSSFTAFYSVEDIIFDLNHFSETADDKSTVHGPPKYVYYDPVFADDEFSQQFFEDLEEELSGYSEDYFKKHFTRRDKWRIEHWKRILGLSNRS